MVWVKGHQLQNGKYVIEEVLGQGGFGITYKALNTEINQYIVIKTPNEYLKHDPDYDKYVKRFIKEGLTLAKLSQDPHPHIVRIHKFFQEEDTYCLVMDFVDGENLFQMVRRRGRIPEKEAVKYIQQIGAALEDFHRVGAVHRDAHPGNIIIGIDGNAILIDFGIAKELIPTTQTSTGNAGNEGFAPYEQLYKGSREITVDIYCLAATLYFILTGERPSNSITRKLDNTHLITPRDIVSSISKGVNEAIIQGMALEAKDRPQTMQEWLDMLLPLPTVKLYSPSVSSSSETVDRVPLRQTRQTKPTKPLRERINIKRIKKITWGRLIRVMGSYAYMSFLLASLQINIYTWLFFWAVAVAGAVAVAITFAVAETFAAIAGAVAVAVTFAGAGALAGALAGILAGFVAVAMVETNDRLESELFSIRDKCLILYLTSCSGILLGWLTWHIFSLLNS